MENVLNVDVLNIIKSLIKIPYRGTVTVWRIADTAA